MDFQLNIDSETISHLDVGEPLCVAPHCTVRDALRLLQQHNRGCALVVEREQLQGIWTERDAVRLLAAPDASVLDGPISRVMTSSPVAVTTDESVASAIKKMSSGGFRRLPVVDANRRPRGVLKVSTVLHYLVQHFPKIIYNLPPDPRKYPGTREGA